MDTETKVIEGVVNQAVPTAVSQMPQPKAEVAVQPRMAIVTKGENTYEFDRVDMMDQVSIVLYGSECQRQMYEILVSTAKMSVKQQKTFLSDEMLGKIVSFDESLEEAKRSQERKEGLFKRLWTEARLIVNDKSAKKEESMKTYEGRYIDYSANLDLVEDNIKAIGQDAIDDIKLRKTIIKEMIPIIEKLEAMEEVGREDKALFDEETLRISEVDQTPDGQAMVVYRTQLSNVFAEQLNSIAKVLIMYKAQIQDYQIQQNTSMTIALRAFNFCNQEKPILQAQASVQIFNQLDSERLDSLLRGSEAANLAIQQNAEHLVSNAEKARELALNGGITIESIETVKNKLSEGVRIVIDTKKQRAERIAKEEVKLNEISVCLDENERKILQIIDGTADAVLALEEARSKGNTKSLRSSTSTRPRLGRKKQ